MEAREAPTAPRQPRRRRWKRYVALTALVGLPVAAFASRRAWLPPLLLSYARGVVRDALGGELSVERVSGDLWHTVVLEGLRIERVAPDAVLERLDATRVEVELRPDAFLEAVRGDPLALLARVAVRSEGLVVDAAAGSGARTDSAAEPWELPTRADGGPELVLELGPTTVRLPPPAGEPSSGGVPPPSGSFALEGLSIAGRPLAESSVRIRGARVGGRTIDELAFSVVPEGARLCVPELRANAGENRLVARGLVVPLLLDDPVRALRETRGAVSLDLRDAAGLLPPPAAGTEPRSFPAHRATFAADLDAQGLAWTTGGVETAGGSLFLQQGRLAWPGEGRSWSEARLSLDFQVSFDELRRLGELLGQDDWSGSLHGALVLEGTLDALQGRLDLSGEDVRAGGFDAGHVEVRARVVRDRVEVLEIESSTELLALRARGTWLRDEDRLEGVELEVDAPRLARLLPGVFADGAASAALTASGPRSAPRGSVVVTARSVDAGGVRASDARLTARFEGASLDPFVLEAHGELGAVEAAGRVAARPGGGVRVEIVRLGARRAETQLWLQAPAVVDVGPDGVQVSPFALTSGFGSATGEVTRTGDETSFRLSWRDLRTPPYLDPRITAGWTVEGLDGSLSGTLRGDDLSLDVALTAQARGPHPPDREIGDEAAGPDAEAPWTVETDAELRDGRLVLRGLRALHPVLGGLWAQGEVPLEPLAPAPEGPLADGPVRLSVVGRAQELQDWPWLADLALEPSGDAFVRGELAGTWGGLTGRLSVASDSLSFRDPARRRRDGIVGPLGLDLELELGERVAVRAGSVRTTDLGEIRIDGGIDKAVDARELLADGGAAWANAPLDLRAVLDVRDMSFVARATPALRRMGGTLSGEVRVTGTVGEPDVSGGVALLDAELRLASAAPAMKRLNGRLEIEGRRLRIVGLAGEFGAAPFAITGTVDLEGEEPVLDVSLRGANLLLFRSNEVQVRADANLALRGPVSGLTATGRVELTDGRLKKDLRIRNQLFGSEAPRVTRGIDLSFWHEPPLARMAFDVEIRAKRAFQVRSNVMQAELRPELHLGGTGEVPILTGPIYVDPSTVRLPSGTIEVSSGLVEFLPEDPFVPKIDAQARARLRGYDVRATVSGDYDDPEIELSSVPPLSNESLLVLFLTGQLPAGSASDVGLGAAESVAVFLTQDFFTRWLGGDDESGDSFLDRLEVRRGEDVSRDGVLTTSVSFRLRGSATGTGKTFYLKAEQDAYDKINFGYGIRFRFP